MFNTTLDVRIGKVEPKLHRDKDENIARFTIVELLSDFDDDIAAGFGEVGQDELKHLRSGAKRSGTIYLDSVEVKCKFNGSSGQKTLSMKGLIAACRRPNKEDSQPTVKIRMRMPTSIDDLEYFVGHLDEVVKVTMERIQEDLPGTK